jgi:hypothetical protein
MAEQNGWGKYAPAAEAEKAFERAWNDPRRTRFEAPPININHVLEAHYDSTPPARMTAADLWDNEVKKSRDPVTFIPGVVRASLRSGGVGSAAYGSLSRNRGPSAAACGRKPR